MDRNGSPLTINPIKSLVLERINKSLVQNFNRYFFFEGSCFAVHIHIALVPGSIVRPGVKAFTEEQIANPLGFKDFGL